MDFSFLIIGNFFQRMAFCISITKVFLLLEDAIASKKLLWRGGGGLAKDQTFYCISLAPFLKGEPDQNRKMKQKVKTKFIYWV